MTRFTISAAARICGCDRRTLQRAVQAGRLTLDAQHCLSREALIAAGYLDASAPHETPQLTPQFTPHLTPHDEPHVTPQVMTRMLALLEAMAEDIHALRTRLVVPRTPTTPLERPVALTPQVTPHVTPHAVRYAAETPQADAAPVPHHDAITPHGTPHTVADMPQGTPREPATPERPPALLPHVLAIAEIAAQYDKLSLAELSQLLFDRGIYRATDRTTGVEKPVNRGTLGRWLEQARAAGVL